MKSTVREELFNLPNMLTLARIAAIPIVMAFIWGGEPKDCVIAAWIYSAATLTDFFDGWLARRRGLVTVMGKFLDPLADKLIVMAMLIMLVPLHRVSASLVILILSREITVTGLRAVASIAIASSRAGSESGLVTAARMLIVPAPVWVRRGTTRPAGSKPTPLVRPRVARACASASPSRVSASR